MTEKEGIYKVIKELLDEDINVRYTAAETLGKMKDIRAVDALIKALSDENSYVRARAAESLGQIKDVRAVDALIKAIEDKANTVAHESEKPRSRKEILGVPLDADILYAAPWALGEIGDGKAVDSLIKLMENKDMYIRCHAADALGELGDEKAIDALIKAMNDEDLDRHGRIPWDQKDAAEALGRIGGKRAVDILTKALEKDTSEDVRKSIITALTKIRRSKK